MVQISIPGREEPGVPFGSDSLISLKLLILF